MFQHLIVPVDGSDFSWRALPIAARMAKSVDATVEIVAVVPELADVDVTSNMLSEDLAQLTGVSVDPKVTVLAGDVAPAIAEYTTNINGALIVMSAHGHGRSAAVLGSVADELLREMFGPIVLIGPHVDVAFDGLDGSYVVPLDGSEHAEAAAPLSAAWAIEFGAVPWFVEVLEPINQTVGDLFESAYPARMARDLRTSTGHAIEFEILHGRHPGTAVGDFASRMNASLIFVSTHGRSGLARLRLGSVAAEIIRHAPCPVVATRPPELHHD